MPVINHPQLLCQHHTNCFRTLSLNSLTCLWYQTLDYLPIVPYFCLCIFESSLASFSFQIFIPNFLLFSLPHPWYLYLLLAYYNYNFTSAYLMSNLWSVDFLVTRCLYTCDRYHLQIRRRGRSFPIRGLLAGPSCIRVIRTLLLLLKWTQQVLTHFWISILSV